MQVSFQPPAHLTYCLNVHPGEDLASVRTAIGRHAAAVRAAVAPDARFGLGLRLSHRASLELESAPALDGLNALLAEQGMYVFTLNGFPYGEFHGAAVKENVYRPDWRTSERREYTCRLARQLAALLPENLSGSISTVPGSYKAWIAAPAEVEVMSDQLVDTALCLADLRERSGREIHLGLEPEPDCFLETTAETVDFFNRHFLPRGIRRAAAARGCPAGAAEALLRRHVGVCLDTCHLALQFEEPGAGLERLVREGIRVSKIQLSAALAVPWGAAAAEALRPFCDPVYLHQVKTLAGGRPVSRGDLVSALANPPPPGEPWRIHCHVPLYFDGVGAIGSTAGQLTPGFFRQALAAGVEHFEIETYTFDVLPPALRRLGVDRSLAEEYRWVLARLATV